MNSILNNGFYISPPNYWEDVQMGHKFEGVDYSLYLFINEYQLMSLSTNTLKFDFDIFNSRKEFIDNYKILDTNTLEIIFNPMGEYSAKKHFTILSPNIILDDNLREYNFKYVVGLSYDEFWLHQAIDKGDDIWAASNPLELNLILKDLINIPIDTLNTPLGLTSYLKTVNDPLVLNLLTGFGKEVQTLSKNDYIFDTSTKIFKK